MLRGKSSSRFEQCVETRGRGDWCLGIYKKEKIKYKNERGSRFDV